MNKCECVCLMSSNIRYKLLKTVFGWLRTYISMKWVLIKVERSENESLKNEAFNWYEQVNDRTNWLELFVNIIWYIQRCYQLCLWSESWYWWSNWCLKMAKMVEKWSIFWLNCWWDSSDMRRFGDWYCLLSTSMNNSTLIELLYVKNW